MNLPPHVLRPADAGDRGYIVDSWLQTYRPTWLRAYGGRDPGRQLETIYWSRFGHAGVVESLIDGPRARTMVACLPEGGAWMYGWLCCNGLGALNYLFVRAEFRGQGIARALLESLGFNGRGDVPFTVTHLTPDFSRRVARDRAVRFVNPYRKDAT